MKFLFKIQPYQTEAVESTMAVFDGQVKQAGNPYRRDLGKRKVTTSNPLPQFAQYELEEQEEESIGMRNHDITLTPQALLANIQKIQDKNQITRSTALIKPDGLGACSLDIEMETGTGKTYVYIKTMFELHRRYGWSKFIVVVPSIAIREGVKKSFEMLEEHFHETYQKKADFFVYSRDNLHALDTYSKSADISVMIINTQAFNAFREGARNNEARIIYTPQDAFYSRRPIDVLSANRPIIIMDEPQKMEGKATQEGLKRFCPLFVLNYSATHKTAHNCIYALDALDAYKQKLVKKIQVKGITLHNLRGSEAYIYFDSIKLSQDLPPKVRLEIEVKHSSGTRRELHTFGIGDRLDTIANLTAYKGFTLSDIDPYTNTILFINGEEMHQGEVMGDVSERTIQRVQIRQTIESHFQKEQYLFERGIKTLSLFFIDEVAHYKGYNEEGQVVPGYLWTLFEEEYKRFVAANVSLFAPEYQAYLHRSSAEEVHNGYFSIDKKGHAIDSKTTRGDLFSGDVSAYDLILKNKEQLLDFAEPTRFIFSHSALREGWDNPNVFQICTLRHAASTIAKRQEVGRGLRLCVNQQGIRMDYLELGEEVHEVNKLTVIANESYSSFVDSLQRETQETLRERPTKASLDYFMRFSIPQNGEKRTLSEQQASGVVSWLFDNDYIDENGILTPKYYQSVAEGTLAPMGAKLSPIREEVLQMIEGIYNPSVLRGMIEDGNESTAPPENRLNENAQKKEFLDLWREINHKYVYTVHYDSEELIRNAVNALNRDLHITALKYTVTTGSQGADSLDFSGTKSTQTHVITEVCPSTIAYDLVGEIAQGASLTRRTVVRILQGLTPARRQLFCNNPEEFIREVVKMIKAEKASMIVEGISYNRTEGTYDLDIFTKKNPEASLKNAYRAKKSILDYVFTDSKVEREFAEALDGATLDGKEDEVVVYAKLPRSFKIPTPVGSYAPDWAIAFNDKADVKHVFFVAETKGSMESLYLRRVEEAKIKCASRLYNEPKDSRVRYHQVTSYSDLLDELNKMD